METDITLTREDADQIQTTLGKARIAVSKINPTLAYQLLHCIKALDPKPEPERDPQPAEAPEGVKAAEDSTMKAMADRLAAEKGTKENKPETKSD